MVERDDALGAFEAQKVVVRGAATRIGMSHDEDRGARVVVVELLQLLNGWHRRWQEKALVGVEEHPEEPRPNHPGLEHDRVRRLAEDRTSTPSSSRSGTKV